MHDVVKSAWWWPKTAKTCRWQLIGQCSNSRVRCDNKYIVLCMLLINFTVLPDTCTTMATKFYVIHVFALIANYIDNSNKMHIISQLKCYNSDIFRPSSCHIQGVHINCMYKTYILWINVTSRMPKFEPRTSHIRKRRAAPFLIGYNFIAVNHLHNTATKTIFFVQHGYKAPSVKLTVRNHASYRTSLCATLHW